MAGLPQTQVREPWLHLTGRDEVRDEDLEPGSPFNLLMRDNPTFPRTSLGLAHEHSP